MTAVLECFADRLTAYARVNLKRVLEPNTEAQGAEISINGRRLLNFCSNDYLGLANHPQLKAATIAGVQRYGVGAGSSALLSGHSAAHELLANQLARFLKRERAILFSSGYLANLGVLSGLVSRHDSIFHDKLNHASLIDGVRLTGAQNSRYPHAECRILDAKLAAINTGQSWLVTDGVFSMDGDLAPLSDLADLATKHNAILICDDAHGFGVVGEGEGTVTEFGLSEKQVPLLIVTFGKALGTIGAAVVGPAVLIENLIHAARTFIYDTALPPALAHATSTALSLMRDDVRIRERLFANIRYFHQGLEASGLRIPRSTTPIQPFIIGDSSAALHAAAQLLERNLYVRAVRPPTVPKGTARLRICLSAAHTTSHIDRLVDGLCTVKSLCAEQLGER
ncbi:MAG: 8-amino-7-oxononanoate synthase [Gammaproteobacteria bacterium]|nr:8-amino-7-oxononanoate synthase [Gammaproteobacteria bacterium]